MRMSIEAERVPVEPLRLPSAEGRQSLDSCLHSHRASLLFPALPLSAPRTPDRIVSADMGGTSVFHPNSRSSVHSVSPRRRHARNSIEERLLLHAARVRDDEPRISLEHHHVQVPHRIDEPKPAGIAPRNRFSFERRASSRVEGKNDRNLIRQARQAPRQSIATPRRESVFSAR